MKFKVCGKWELDVGADLLAVSDVDLMVYADKNVDLMPYNHALARRLSDVSKGAWCYKQVCEYLKPFCHDRVIEYFGGIGRASLIIEKVLRPKAHTIVELDEQLTIHLRRTFPGCLVLKANSYDIKPHLVDMAFADCNSMTVAKITRDEDWWCGVMNNSGVVVVNDTAVSRLQLHRDSYGKRLGMGRGVMSIMDYLAGYSVFLYNKFSKSVEVVYRHRRNCYLVLVNKRPGPFDIIDAPNNPSCFGIL